MPRAKKSTQPTATEHQECVAFAEYLCLKGLRFTHVPNETYTSSWKAKNRNKAEGVSRGVPDYMILIERCEPMSGIRSNTLLIIEMKRERGGKVSREQQGWINAFNEVYGVAAMVCRGFAEAKIAVDAFLEAPGQNTRVTP
jgi:hypothetical protein